MELKEKSRKHERMKARKKQFGYIERTGQMRVEAVCNREIK
jgi:hypothetical protein